MQADSNNASQRPHHAFLWPHRAFLRPLRFQATFSRSPHLVQITRPTVKVKKITGLLAPATGFDKAAAFFFASQNGKLYPKSETQVYGVNQTHNDHAHASSRTPW